MPVRTRFAPSPTGFLHVGNVRSALFPWLVARQSRGVFVLRIEDTDRSREVSGAVKVMHEALSWLGITWDEGPDVGGDFGPYVQSQRAKQGIYLPWAQKLIAKGLAYADVRSAEELEALRDQAKRQKRPFLARNCRPKQPPAWRPGLPLRFKSTPKAYSWHDEIMGELSAGEEAVDDFILLKADGMPTYNFAHIVDDFEMKISHVIRGSEYVSSMPKYLSLYEALEIPPPLFAHAPHVLAQNGNKKLSKRDGAKGILDYRDNGFLPEAILNFLASLGWNDGTEQEVFSAEELIAKFSLSRVQKSGARFDENRLLWLNGQWIRRTDPEELYRRAAPYWPSQASSADHDYKKRILTLVADRLKTLGDLPAMTGYFFSEPKIDLNLILSNRQLKKLPPGQLADLLDAARSSLQASDFSAEDLHERLNALLSSTGQKPAVLFGLIRIAVTWAPFSPELAGTLSALGKAVSTERLENAAAALRRFA